MWFRLDTALSVPDQLNVNLNLVRAKKAGETVSAKMHPFGCWVCTVRLFETLTTLSSQMVLQTVQCLTFFSSEHCLLDKDDEHDGILLEWLI